MSRRIITPRRGREEGLSVYTVTDASQPITTAVMKAYLKIDYSDEDTLIDSLINSAWKEVEGYLGRKIGSQTLRATWQRYAQKTRVPYPPISSITTVKLKNGNTTTTLTENDDYYLHGDDDKWIEFTSIDSQILIVDFVAGYSTVPEAILTAIKRIVANVYEYREDIATEAPASNIDNLTAKMLAPYVVHRL